MSFPLPPLFHYLGPCYGEFLTPNLHRCVSGTPVKKDARDLFGLIDFLHYKPYCDFPPHVWERLVRQHKSVFKRIFRTLALRHTKDQIKDELQLPPQRRVVITVPFTQIEEQHYSTMFGQMAEDCGLHLDGTPRTDDWDPDSPATIEKMRSWLSRLRQTCLHPEVGARNRRALGNGRGPLRTVGEVLEVMIEQNDIATRLEERTVGTIERSFATLFGSSGLHAPGCAPRTCVIAYALGRHGFPALVLILEFG